MALSPAAILTNDIARSVSLRLGTKWHGHCPNVDADVPHYYPTSKLMCGGPLRDERYAAARINALLEPARENSELPTSSGSTADGRSRSVRLNK